MSECRSHAVVPVRDARGQLAGFATVHRREDGSVMVEAFAAIDGFRPAALYLSEREAQAAGVEVRP